MIGVRIERTRNNSLAYIMVLIAVTGGVVGAVADLPNLLMLSLIPSMIGMVLLITRPRAFAMRFESTGIIVESPKEDFVPFRSIQFVCADPNAQRYEPPSFRIDVVHRGGILQIPANLTVDSIEVMEFLKAQMEVDPLPKVSAQLESFIEEETELFGMDRVHIFGTAPRITTIHSARLCYFSLGTIVVAILWLVLSDHIGWNILSFLTILIGVVMLAIFYSTYGMTDNVDQQGGLVVSPTGIALHQGKLVGKMRWDEITGIELPSNHRYVTLRIAGGSIRLNDVYDQSLPKIYGCLRSFWD